MTVIAMTREMGSLGRDVALGLANELGLELIQHELVAHVAEKMHVLESSVNRFLEGQAGFLERWGINESEFSLYTTEEILDVAARGNVLIRGWGAAYILRDVPHIARVRICGSFSRRVDVLMERIGVDDRNVAFKEIRKSDAAHARTMMHLFHANFEDPLLYDLVLNTDYVSVETCVALVRELASRADYAETEETRSKLEDMRLKHRVMTALHANDETKRSPPSFEVELVPGTGRVKLTGIAYHHDFRNEAERVVEPVPGVAGVDNEMAVVQATGPCWGGTTGFSPPIWSQSTTR